jgi:ferredoxin
MSADGATSAQRAASVPVDVAPAGRAVAGGLVVLRVDRHGCLGTGLCQAMSPDLFEVAADGRAVVLAGPRDRGAAGSPDDDLLEEARAAAECCPAGAIEVTVTPVAGSPPATRPSADDDNDEGGQP